MKTRKNCVKPQASLRQIIFRKSLLTAWGLIISFGLFSQGEGSVVGKITSNLGVGIPGVNIVLENTNIGTSTNGNGEYKLSNIAGGDYNLIATAIGFVSEKKPIAIVPEESVTVSFSLKEGVELLNEFSLVEGEREKYSSDVSAMATRTPIPLTEIPQSIQVLTSQIQEDQQAFTLGEMASNVAGLTKTSPFGETTGRGFASPNPPIHIYYNGIKGSMFNWPQAIQLYNVERIEYIKGPASVLFGDGTPGGIQNIVTKKPQKDRLFQFTTNYSSWNSFRATADATGSLSKNKKLMYRLIAGFEEGDSFRDFQKRQNFFVAPNLSYLLGENTLLNVELNYFKENNSFANDRGIYATVGAGNTINYDASLSSFSAGNPNDYRKGENLLLSTSLNHRFSTNLGVNVVSRYFLADISYREHLPDFFAFFFSSAVVNDTLPRLHLQYNNVRQGVQNTVFSDYTIKKGDLENQLVVGIDQSYTKNPSSSQEGVAAPLNVLKPDYSKDLENYTDGYFWSDEVVTYQTFGAYVQNKISLGKISAILGLRYDKYHQLRAVGKAFEQNKTKADTALNDVWIPRYGLVYNPIKNISFYGSYCQSFEPQTTSSRFNGISYKDIAPKTGKQYEVGYKGQYFKSNFITEIALYQIDYVNILAADLTDSTNLIGVLVPGARSKGVEVGLQGKIYNVGIIVNYAYNESKYTEDSDFGKKGDKFPGNPAHLFNAWLKYSFSKTALKGFGVGAGIEYSAEKIGGFNGSNTEFMLPAYTIFQSSISYSSSQWYVGLNLYNLTNERYFIGAYNPGSLFIGPPINFRTMVKYTIK